MDASEGHQLLHARRANEIESDDEHWLWTHVGRIKRSIESVLRNDNGHLSKRIKRGFWPWENDNESETTETTTTAKSLFDFDLFGSNNDEKTTATTKSSKEDDRSQNDGSVEDENVINQDDLDTDLIEGSGSSKNYEAEDTDSPYCKLNILIL